MVDVLSRIIAKKFEEVRLQKQLLPYSALERELEQYSKPVYSLFQSLAKSQSGIISEFKRRSPSKPKINLDAVASVVAKGYSDSGAAAISVLTDESFFGGSISDLTDAVNVVEVPVLRKEFIIDEYQILESRLLGASAILLIASALTKEEVKRFTDFAISLGLEVLLELHDEGELDHITPQNNIIGINNRNLGTFETTVEKSYAMAKYLPDDAVWVAESGISSPYTVVELRKAGYRGFLIGEYFMKNEDPAKSLAHFLHDFRMI